MESDIFCILIGMAFFYQIPNPMKSTHIYILLSILFCQTISHPAGYAQEIDRWIAVNEIDYPGKLRAFTVDPDNNLYAIWTSAKEEFAYDHTCYLVAFDQEGAVIQKRTLEAGKYIQAITIDSKGTLILTGTLLDTADLQKLFLEKQTLMGGTIWQKAWDSPFKDDCVQLHRLANDDIVVLATFGHMRDLSMSEDSLQYIIDIGGQPISFKAREGGQDCLIRLSPEGTVKWAKKTALPLPGTGSVELVVGPQDQLFLSGTVSYDHFLYSKFQRYSLKSHPMYIGNEKIFFTNLNDNFIIKLSPAGEIEKTFIFNYRRTSVTVQRLAIDHQGNMIVGGGIDQGTSFPEGVFPTLPQEHHSGLFLAKLSPNGAPLWNLYFGTEYVDYFNGIEIGDQDEIYLSFGINLTMKQTPDTVEVIWNGELWEKTPLNKHYLVALNDLGNVLWKDHISEKTGFHLFPSPKGLWAYAFPDTYITLGGHTLDTYRWTFPTHFFIKY